MGARTIGSRFLQCAEAVVAVATDPIRTGSIP